MCWKSLLLGDMSTKCWPTLGKDVLGLEEAPAAFPYGRDVLSDWLREKLNTKTFQLSCRRNCCQDTIKNLVPKEPMSSWPAIIQHRRTKNVLKRIICCYLWLRQGANRVSWLLLTLNPIYYSSAINHSKLFYKVTGAKVILTNTLESLVVICLEH